MKKITIFLILILAGCTKNDCSYNEKIRKIETEKILEILIKQKNIENSKDIYAVCNSLKKIKIITESVYTKPTKKVAVVKLPPRLPKILQNTDIYIEMLLSANLKGKKIFKNKDSIHFIEQNNCFLKYILPEKISKKLKIIPVSKIDKADDYIILSIPIFSEDNKKAYMEIDCYSKELPYGKSVYLEKKDNIWKIVYTQNIWVKCAG
ncbi:hypothetical protein GON26_10770 [Flavobacterium sp. GA093]|uniref:Lipoprotein n=1 Tax=Flavobacterium hydrocarbonoxydans TaxID=2683249 RepID=A0A6I4NKD2_9FLAO|nr:hypothetical protein [Flavobacterium hydrocarbonoxydans]MWB94850.1 hypothetical protein [Flavobacterium hydrocarbonoxydans]